MIFGRDEGPSVTILLSNKRPRDVNIKEVKVLGESAKTVTYEDEYSDDFSMRLCIGLLTQMKRLQMKTLSLSSQMVKSVNIKNS